MVGIQGKMTGLSVELLAFARELGLQKQEVKRVASLLGQVPSLLHLRMFAAMWSEHCSYKRSRRWLQELPTQAPWVLEGPGEGAGIVQLDEETAVAFKMESHNHPSAVEPFQGAATGVGGILRDIISMGARPVALLDCLRFASPRHNERHQYLMERVVEGIAWYGNCMGIPTVGGDLRFAPCYQDNPLVNAMAVGLLHPKSIVPSRATGVGNVLLLFGSATGREGLHGATFASQDLDPAKQTQNRSSVQVGDPFTGKLLMEASLELARQPYVLGLQDLGAAGLLCASSEMAFHGEGGAIVDLDCVHTRGEGLQPWELLLSETQERMLVCVEASHVEDAIAIVERWELPARVVGTVVEEPFYTLRHKGEELLRLPTRFLIQEAPFYDLPYAPKKSPASPVETVKAPQEQARSILRDLQWCSRRWVFQQYDHMVGCQTLVEPGTADAAVMKPHGKSWGLALTAGGVPDALRHRGMRDASIAMLAECTRELIAVGARPLAITNCLNFPSPEEPHQYFDFVETIQGMKQACLAFHTL